MSSLRMEVLLRALNTASVKECLLNECMGTEAGHEAGKIDLRPDY